MQYVYDAYDGKYWNYADTHTPKQLYLYQIFKFVKPDTYSIGTLRWRIWGTSGLETKMWLWNKTTKTWVNIGSISGTSPSVQNYGPIPAGAFGNDNDLYVMATVQEGITTHNIVADLVDIQY